MVYKEDDIDISVNDEHPQKANFSIITRDDGIDIFDNDEHDSKARSLIIDIEEGINKLVNFSQFLKHSDSIMFFSFNKSSIISSLSFFAAYCIAEKPKNK